MMHGSAVSELIARLCGLQPTLFLATAMYPCDIERRTIVECRGDNGESTGGERVGKGRAEIG